ncbi:MAG TPA: argininosuccinate synthase [Nitrososphaerales archaeon]
MKDKVVLAFSGGLDTSVSIKWLQEKQKVDVITATVDVGQGDNLKEIEEKAYKIGVKKHYSIDAKKEFVDDYVFPSIKANGLYEGKYPLATALARPLIASKLVEVAEKEGASAVSHGCTGKGNDQVRFDVTIKALNPSLKIVAPVREWNMSRDEEIKYAKKHNIPIQIKKSVYSIDQNLWGRSIESGPLEDPSNEPSNEVFEWTTPIEKTPDKAEYVNIAFENGIPTSINGKSGNMVQTITRLNQTVGKHGVGFIDHMEDRLVGIKSRETYEAPAATAIIEAHKDLEKLVLTRHELQAKVPIEQQWAWLVYSGLWVEPLMDALNAFIDETQKRVNGSVKLKLYKGNCRVVGRNSPNSLYNVKLATYTSSSSFNQRSAEGFIELWGLPSRVAKGVKKGGLAKRRKAN